MITNQRIGFIGGGKMAEAIIAGITEKRPELEVYVYDIDEKRIIILEESYGVKAVSSIDALLQESSVVLLAVKPQVLGKVLEGSQQLFTENHLLISIAAGIPLSKIQSLAQESRVIRVMPNTPALIGQASSVLCTETANDADKELATDIFLSVGHAYWMEEKYFDSVTAISGSGPAYIYLFIEALIDAGVNQGLPRDIARKLSIDTVIGSAMMVDVTGKHPAELRDMVTSPGGTTIRAVEIFEELGLRNAVIKAVAAAAQKSKELGE
ncbi:pyrroline-5-carboxylate reductase [Clostridia bacterium]|nr:pyrroline-5-carboxylate reductase [Clostridia bacterium]